MRESAEQHAIAPLMGKLWEPLSDEERQTFIQQLGVMHCDAQQTIFSRGDVPTYLYYLIEGRVTIYSGEKGANELIVRMVEPGSIFGMQAAFTGIGQHSTTAIGEEGSVVAYLPLQLVYHLIWEKPAYAMLFIRELSELLGTSVNYTIHLTQKNIRGRLAESLLRMKKKYGVEDDGQTLPIYLSRNDLAMMSNMSTSNAIRTLSSFVSEGIVAFNGRKIRILNEEALLTASRLC